MRASAIKAAASALAAAAVLLGAPAWADGGRTPAGADSRSDYATLLARLKGGDLGIDFKALRAAYARSPQYHPYGGDAGARQGMIAAYKAGEWAKALAASDQVLASDYLDLDAQFIASQSHSRLGQADQAAFHRAIFVGLLKPLLDSGDGKTPQTAYVVLSVPEEYTVIGYLGRRPTGQSVVRSDGHVFDQMAVKDSSGAASSLYFNVDQPLGWLDRSAARGQRQ